jgi:hypothetical protein
MEKTSTTTPTPTHPNFVAVFDMPLYEGRWNSLALVGFPAPYQSVQVYDDFEGMYSMTLLWVHEDGTWFDAVTESPAQDQAVTHWFSTPPAVTDRVAIDYRGILC